MNKTLPVVLVLVVFGLVGVLLFRGDRRADPVQETGSSSPVSASASTPDGSGTNVFMEDGKQIVEIRAKGGYSPKESFAKAGVPTVLRFVTDATYDCSSSVRVPSLSVNRTLPSTGITDIGLGIPAEGRISATCGMGMYRLDIQFRAG